jgi:Acetyltransferase (GNAT) family
MATMARYPIDRCSRADFDYITNNLESFWEGSPGQLLHQPPLLEKCGESAYVIREGEVPIAYLMGFIDPGPPRTGYIQLISARKDHRRHHLASCLYDHFVAYAVAEQCKQLKSVTAPENLKSILFHLDYGMTLEKKNDYAGPGMHRIICAKWI